MFLGLHVPPADSLICTEFVLDNVSRSKRRLIKYHETSQLVASHAANVEGLVIPFEAAGIDYDPLYLIEHIRLDSDPAVAGLPIYIQTRSTIEWDRAVEHFPGSLWNLLEEIGVDLLNPGSQNEFKADGKIDTKSLRRYTESVANAPRFGSGSHDMANVWGSFSLLLALSQATSLCDKQLDSQRNLLAEDTYYKKKLKGFADSDALPQWIKQIADLRSNLKFLIESKQAPLFRVLIVDDELENGWLDAYSATIGSLSDRVEVVAVGELQKAREAFSPSFDLVLLDVRLANDRKAPTRQHDYQSIEALSGVILANHFRRYGPSVPLIAATASNKAWTMEEMLRYGISGYWIKESPATCLGIDQCCANLVALYKKITAVLSWSLETRPAIDSAYELAKQMPRENDEGRIEMKRKAESLHALFHLPFNPFSAKLDAGLQDSIAFLTAYSMVNEIVMAACQCAMTGREGKLTYTVPDGHAIELARINEGNRFAESDALVALLGAFGMREEQARFITLRELRNKLTVTHGRIEAPIGINATARNASKANVVGILEIYGKVIDRLKQDMAAARAS